MNAPANDRLPALLLLGAAALFHPLPASAQVPALPDAAPGSLLEPTPGTPTFAARVRPDPAAARLSARWRVGFVADESTREAVTFAMARDLDLHQVEGRGVAGFRAVDPGEGAPFQLHAIALDGVRPGDRVELELGFSGAPALSSDGMVRLDEGWIELMLDGFWFPLFASFDQAMRGTLEVELPEGWTVISGGGSTFAEGLHRLPFTAPGVDAHFVAAPAVERIESDGFVLFHHGADPARVGLVLEAARDCALHLNARFGGEDPLRDMRIVLTDRDQVSYQRPNFISVGGMHSDDLVEAHTLFCHEMAHHWAQSSDFMAPDHWMSEAFAEYAAARFIRERHGEGAFEAQVAAWARVGETVGPVWTPELTERPSFALMYRRGPLLLARLEDRVGEEVFDRFLARYMIEGAPQTVHLLEMLGDVAGDEVRAWFQEALASAPAAAPGAPGGAR